MYGNGLDVLDVVDISILRSINSKYKFIMSAAKVIDLNKNDKNFLKNPTEIAEVHAKIDGEIRELKENLFYLLIKWKKDLILD